MRFFSIKNHALILAAAIALSTGDAQAANLNLCGGSPGGLWSLLGVGLDTAVKQVDANSTITYQTSSGGYANILQVKQKKCDLGIIHVGEGIQANKGGAPFKAPVKGFSVLMVLYDWAPMQWIMTKAFADKHA